MAESDPLGISERVFLCSDCDKLELWPLSSVHIRELMLSFRSITVKFRVDLELIAPAEYLGVSPAFCVDACKG